LSLASSRSSSRQQLASHGVLRGRCAVRRRARAARGGRVPGRAVRVQRRHRGAARGAGVRDARPRRRVRGVEGRDVRRGARAGAPALPAPGLGAARRAEAAGVLLLPRRRVLHRVPRLAQLPELLPPPRRGPRRARRGPGLPPRARAPPPRGRRRRRGRGPVARGAGAGRRRRPVGRRIRGPRPRVRLGRLRGRQHRAPPRRAVRLPGRARGARARRRPRLRPAHALLRRRRAHAVGGGVPRRRVPQPAPQRPVLAPVAAGGRHGGPPRREPVRARRAGAGGRGDRADGGRGRGPRHPPRPRRGLRGEAQGHGEARGGAGLRGAAARLLHHRPLVRRLRRAHARHQAVRRLGRPVRLNRREHT
jgi:hypothetical protein